MSPISHIDIILIRYGELKVATTVDTLIKYLCAKEWEINLTEIQGLATLVKVPGVQYEEISKGKVQLLYQAVATIKEDAQ
jgi:hypothetical protein